MTEGLGRAPRLRSALAAVCLLVLAVSMAATLPPSELARRWHLFFRSVSGDRFAPLEGTSFWFDRDYGVFLEEVRRRTPEDATVAVFVPSWPDVYVYQAAYQLAPRRVVTARWAKEATFVAQYRASAGAPGAVGIPHGILRRQ